MDKNGINRILLVNTMTILGAFILLMGAIYIYVSNRSWDMQLYSWLGIDTECAILTSIKNQSRDLASWVRYNLPDGLWLLSYLLLMDGIWRNDIVTKWIFCIPVILFALLLEVLQFNGYISGTGDVLDIVFYIVAVLLFIVLIKLKQIYYEKNN